MDETTTTKKQLKESIVQLYGAYYNQRTTTNKEAVVAAIELLKEHLVNEAASKSVPPPTTEDLAAQLENQRRLHRASMEGQLDLEMNTEKEKLRAFLDRYKLQKTLDYLAQFYDPIRKINYRIQECFDLQTNTENLQKIKELIQDLEKEEDHDTIERFTQMNNEANRLLQSDKVKSLEFKIESVSDVTERTKFQQTLEGIRKRMDAETERNIDSLIVNVETWIKTNHVNYEDLKGNSMINGSLLQTVKFQRKF
jgi:hypothetical protein